MGARDVQFHAVLDERGRPPRLIVSGELDAATVDRFDHAVRAAVRRCPRLIVDLTAVEFVSSWSIAVLFVHTDHIIAVRVTPGGLVARALNALGYPHVISYQRPVEGGSGLDDRAALATGSEGGRRARCADYILNEPR
jgi:anti-anti-sigma factor